MADEEEWCPSASSVQKRKSRGQRRIAYAELSDSDSDCMIDEERSTFRTAKVVPAASLLVSMNGGILPGTTINNDSSLSNASKVFKSFPVEVRANSRVKDRYSRYLIIRPFAKSLRIAFSFPIFHFQISFPAHLEN